MENFNNPPSHKWFRKHDEKLDLIIKNQNDIIKNQQSLADELNLNLDFGTLLANQENKE